MAGPNLEIFKFGFYMFFPIYTMFKFGDPEWYETYVQPYKEILWPAYEDTYQPPRTHTGIKEELARMKAERIAKKTGRSVETISQDEIDAEGGARVNLSASTPQSENQPQPQVPANPSIPTTTTNTNTSWSWPKAGNNNERLV